MQTQPTLLVVDDTETNIDILVELLGDTYEIAVALDGESALEILDEQDIDLVLLDIMMPGMDGYDVCHRIKQDETTQHIPVIFITAKADEESIEKAYDVGGADYTTKPFKPRELLARIRIQLQLKELIDALQHSKEELKHLSETDPMTGLWNRRYFAATARTVWSLAQRDQSDLSIVMLDIDHFKQVNDTYGHPAGDSVIIALAQVMKDSIRQSDLACRFGGEEFILLLPETAMRGAMVIAEKIRETTEKLILNTCKEKKVHFTISLGVTQVNLQEDPDVEAAIQRADEALYAAKESGRNCVISRT